MMFPNSSSTQTMRADARGSERRVVVDAVANLLDEPDDQRRADSLLVVGRGDVDRVAGADELVGVEVRVRGGLPCAVALVGAQDAGRG